MLLQRMHHGRPLLLLHDPLLVIPATSSSAGIPERPALAPWCRLADDNQRVLIEHGGTVVTFEGGAARLLLPKLLPLLDGTRTVDDLMAAMGAPAAPAIENALTLLATHRLLLDGEHRSPNESDVTAAASYAAAVTRGTTQAAALEAIAEARVTVLGASSAANETERQLRATGIGCVARAPLDADFDGDSLLIAAPRMTA